MDGYSSDEDENKNPGCLHKVTEVFNHFRLPLSTWLGVNPCGIIVQKLVGLMAFGTSMSACVITYTNSPFTYEKQWFN
jgi:hypothetical protein